MCWITKEKPVKKVAEEDIKVFKVFNVRNDGVITSPIYDHIVWNHGEIKESELENPKSSRTLGRTGVLWSIDIGLHSLITEPKISVHHFSLVIGWCIGNKALFSEGNEALSCVIPKGAEYYENEDGLIVSNKLMLI